MNVQKVRHSQSIHVKLCNLYSFTEIDVCYSNNNGISKCNSLVVAALRYSSAIQKRGTISSVYCIDVLLYSSLFVSRVLHGESINSFSLDHCGGHWYVRGVRPCVVKAAATL